MKIFNKFVLKGDKTMVKDPETGKLKARNGLEDVMEEIKTMQKLDSDRVVRLHEVIDTEDSDYLCMVIDFCGQG